MTLNRIHLNEQCVISEMQNMGPRDIPYTLILGPGHIQDLKVKHPEAGRRKVNRAMCGSDLYDRYTTPITKVSDPPFKHAIIFNRVTAAQTNVQVPEFIYKSRNGSCRMGKRANQRSEEVCIQGLDELPEVARRGQLKVLIGGSRIPLKPGVDIWEDVLSAAKLMSTTLSKCALVGRDAAMCPCIRRDKEGCLYSYDPTDPLACFYIFDMDIRFRRNSHKTLPQFTKASPGTPMTTMILPLIRELIWPAQRPTQREILDNLRATEVAFRTQTRDMRHGDPDMQKRKAIETVAIQQCMIRTWGSEHPAAPGDHFTRHGSDSTTPHNDTRQDEGSIGSDATLETLIMANQSLEAMEAEREEWAAYRTSQKCQADMDNLLNLHWGAHQECATGYEAHEGYSTMYSNEGNGDVWWDRFVDAATSEEILAIPPHT